MSTVILGFAAWTTFLVPTVVKFLAVPWACSLEIWNNKSLWYICCASVGFSCNVLTQLGQGWKSSVWWIPILFGYVPALSPDLGPSVWHSWTMDEQKKGIPLVDTQRAHISSPALWGQSWRNNQFRAPEHSQNKWGIRTCWAEKRREKEDAIILL